MGEYFLRCSIFSCIGATQRSNVRSDTRRNHHDDAQCDYPRELQMKYYVTTPDGEKGPFEETNIRQWLREGTFPRDAPVRLEGEDRSRPAADVFPGEAPIPVWPSSNAPAGDFGNVYAPPAMNSAYRDPDMVDPGSFSNGLLFGLFCGCIAFIWSLASSNVGSETKRGVNVGFAINFVLGIIIRGIEAASKASNHYPY